MSSPSRRLCSRVGAVLGAALAVTVPASCGGSSHTTSSAGSQTATVPITTTTGGSRTGSSAAGASVKTSAAQPSRTTARANGSTSTSVQPVAPSPGGRLLRRFAGHGNGRLGTLVVRARSLLVWNAGHARIQIFTSTGFMLVNSSSPTGAVRLSRGTYRGVRVSSSANWSVELRSPSP